MDANVTCYLATAELCATATQTVRVGAARHVRRGHGATRHVAGSKGSQTLRCFVPFMMFSEIKVCCCLRKIQSNLKSDFEEVIYSMIRRHVLSRQQIFKNVVNY